MDIITAAKVMLLLFKMINVQSETQNLQDENAYQRHDLYKRSEVNPKKLEFMYWNSKLGNDKPVPVEFGSESVLCKFWMHGLPLKVITHGWKSKDFDVFDVKTAYIETGEYNVITLKWDHISRKFYPIPAKKAGRVGRVLGEFLDNLVYLELIKGPDIHILGYSLGAHVAGECGNWFKNGPIGRITGLDPAGMAFEYWRLRKSRLEKTDAAFVDVIHTTTKLIGTSKAIGDVDFYVNNIEKRQPGCRGSFFKKSSCSHKRAYIFYIDAIHHPKSFLAQECSSIEDYDDGLCKNNKKIFMGPLTDTNVKGVFFLRTSDQAPFGLNDCNPPNQ